MRDSARLSFSSFTQQFEGRVAHLYQDIKGLITTGVGNLVDTVPHSANATAEALSLPWKHVDGSTASASDIEDDWQAVSSRSDLAHQGGRAYASVAQLHLDPADIDRLVESKALANESLMRQQFPQFDGWPADAQLALHSDAWAQGSSFAGWPHLVAALRASPPDFMAAAGPPGDASADTSKRGQAWLNDVGNPGLRPRNLADKILFQNAARVLSQGWDPAELYYPTEIPLGAKPGGRWGQIAGEVAIAVIAVGLAGWGLMAFHVLPEPRWVKESRAWARALGA